MEYHRILMLMSLALPMWMHAGITEPVADGAPVTVTVKVNADPGSFQPVEAIEIGRAHV